MFWGNSCARKDYYAWRKLSRKMTAMPAQRLGLKDRGILRDGMKADIVVFDPEQVEAKATFEDPKQYPEGSTTC